MGGCLAGSFLPVTNGAGACSTCPNSRATSSAPSSRSRLGGTENARRRRLLEGASAASHGSCAWCRFCSQRQGLDEEVACLRGEVVRLHDSLARIYREHAANVAYLRQMPLQFAVGHYNILAGYVGKNTEPWFLYGPEISQTRRKQVLARHSARGADGKPSFLGFEKYTAGILTEDELDHIRDVDERHFKWDTRKDRLLHTIDALGSDIISLVECDHYEDFFEPQLHSLGYESRWKKRPRVSSKDGCCIAWRRSMFDLVAHEVVEYHDKFDASMAKDRIALVALLRVKLNGAMLCIVNTHLARNPEVVTLDYLRTRQVLQMVENLMEFVRIHDAVDAPVILTGDLNAASFGRLRGLVCTMALLRCSLPKQLGKQAVHPFVFDCEDVPTGPTSVTLVRKMRIDAILYQTQRLNLIDKCRVPKLSRSNPIPNDIHPSDHVPICASFQIKSNLAQEYHNARAWFLQISGRMNGWLPLNAEQLLEAFEIYDHDGSGLISPIEMAKAVSLVMGTGIVGPEEINRVLDKFPPQGIDFDGFVSVYQESVAEVGTEGLANFRDAFRSFDESGDGLIDKEGFVELFRACSDVDTPKEELELLFQKVDASGDGKIQVGEFMEYLSTVWNSQISESKNQLRRRLMQRTLSIPLPRRRGHSSPTILSPTTCATGRSDQSLGSMASPARARLSAMAAYSGSGSVAAARLAAAAEDCREERGDERCRSSSKE